MKQNRNYHDVIVDAIRTYKLKIIVNTLYQYGKFKGQPKKLIREELTALIERNKDLTISDDDTAYTIEENWLKGNRL